MGAMGAATFTYAPETGDYVVVPNCALLPGVGKVVGFTGGRPIVASLACPNITVAVKSVKRVKPERCTQPDHPDCLVSVELAIDCAHFTRQRLAKA